MARHVRLNETKKMKALFGVIGIAIWTSLAVVANGQQRSPMLPNIPCPNVAPATDEERAQIMKLIDDLSEIDDIDFQDVFLPTGVVVGFRHWNWGEPCTPLAVQKLTAFGPKALPFLIDALDDNTATRAKINDKGEMRFENDPEKRVTEYTVTIGDICYMAIGQIVGRRYEVVRYEPREFIISSAPQDSKLRSYLEATWGGTAPGQKLFDSLLVDYSTEGEDVDPKGWLEAYAGSDSRANAAMRLLYYFPRESALLIAERLDSLDVSAIDQPNYLPAIAERAKKNKGVEADKLVKATAWCKEPEIKAAILQVFDRATSSDVIVHCLPSVAPDHPEKVRPRLTKMISELPAKNDDPFGVNPRGIDYQLLVGLGECSGTDARSVFEKYIENRSVLRCVTMCHVLRKTQREWAVSFLTPMLDDQRPIQDWYYAIDGAIDAADEQQLPIRICDEAAHTFALVNKNFAFVLKGTHEDLDRQIGSIKERISKMK